MTLKRQQRGITLTGLIGGCILLGTVALLGMKLWPVYNEKMKVDLAMERLLTEPRGAKMTKGQVVKALMRQFDVNDVESFDTPTLVKTVKVGKKKGSRNKIVLLEFEIRSPLFSNLDVIMNYSKSVELEPKAGD